MGVAQHIQAFTHNYGGEGKIFETVLKKARENRDSQWQSDFDELLVAVEAEAQEASAAAPVEAEVDAQYQEASEADPVDAQYQEASEAAPVEAEVDAQYQEASEADPVDAQYQEASEAVQTITEAQQNLINFLRSSMVKSQDGEYNHGTVCQFLSEFDKLSESDKDREVAFVQEIVAKVSGNSSLLDKNEALRAQSFARNKGVYLAHALRAPVAAVRFAIAVPAFVLSNIDVGLTFTLKAVVWVLNKAPGVNIQIRKRTQEVAFVTESGDFDTKDEAFTPGLISGIIFGAIKERVGRYALGQGNYTDWARTLGRVDPNFDNWPSLTPSPTDAFKRFPKAVGRAIMQALMFAPSAVLVIIGNTRDLGRTVFVTWPVAARDAASAYLERKGWFNNSSSVAKGSNEDPLAADSVGAPGVGAGTGDGSDSAAPRVDSNLETKIKSSDVVVGDNTGNGSDPAAGADDDTENGSHVGSVFGDDSDVGSAADDDDNANSQKEEALALSK